MKLILHGGHAPHDAAGVAKFFAILLLVPMLPAISAEGRVEPEEPVAAAANAVSPGEGALETFELEYRDEDEAIEVSPLFPSAEPSIGFFSSKNVHLGLEASVTYDDNIFTDAEGKVSDVVFRITPIIGFEGGDYDARNDSYLRFLYAPTGEIFSDNGSENSFNQDINLDFQYRISKLVIGYDGRFQTLSDATPDVGTRYDRTVYSNILRAAYDLSPRTRFVANGSYYKRDYDDDELLLDSSEWNVEGALEYDYSDKTTFSIGYAYGELDVKEAASQRYHRVIAGIDWDFSQKVTLFAEGGVELRKLEKGDSTTGIYDIGFYYGLREGTDFRLSAYRRVEGSAFYVDQNFTATGIRGSLNQRLGSRFTLGLEAGYERARYESVSGAATPDREDNYFFVRPSLDYAFRDWLSFQLFYLYREDDSSSDEFNYENNQIGAQITLTF